MDMDGKANLGEEGEEEEEGMEGEAFITENEVMGEEIIDKSVPLADDDDDTDEQHTDGKIEMDDEEEAADNAQCVFSAHTDALFAVALNPVNPTMAASGGGDDKGFVWKTETGDVLFAMEGFTDSVNSVAFSVDGGMVAAASMDGTIRVYGTQDGLLIATLEGPAADIEWIAWHPKGPVLCAGSADTTVWMWSAAKGKCMQVYNAHLGAVLCGAFSHDGKVVVTGSEDGSAIVWNPKTGKPIHQIKGYNFHQGPLHALAVHPTTRLLLTGSHDGTGALSNMDTGKVLMKFKGFQGEEEASVEAVGFCSAAGIKWGATACLDGNLKIWDLSTGACRTTCKHPDGVVQLEWVSGEPLVYTACLDKRVRLWDARSGTLLNEWTGHRDAVLALAISADGSMVVSGSDDQTARVFRR